MTLLQVRIATVAAGLLGALLLARKSDRVVEVLRRFFLEPTAAINLAFLRVAMFWMLFSLAGRGHAEWYAALPSSLRKLPHGWRWLQSVLPFDPEVVARADTVFLVASCLAMVGLFTRLSAPVAALSAVYVLGVPNFYLKINHGNHAIVLCALILSFAPSSDALSLDRLWQRIRGVAAPGPSVAYTLPLRLCWLILGTVYLFPGLWKLWDSGDLWFSGAQLKGQLYTKWSQLTDFTPLVRIDEYPWLLALLGTWTVAFETLFIFAILHRGWRVFAALNATAFHLGVKYVMGISFHVYLPLVLLLEVPEVPRLLRGWLPQRTGARVDAWAAAAGRRWRALDAKLPTAPRKRPHPERKVAFTVIVGCSLVFGQLVAGFAPIDSWPIAVHPRFNGRKAKAPTTAKRTNVVLRTQDGRTRDVDALVSKLGSGRMVHLVRTLGKLSRKPKEFEKHGRMVVTLFRNSGTGIDVGDLIEVREERWKIFPLGEREGLKDRLVDTYRVTKKLSLVREKKDG